MDKSTQELVNELALMRQAVISNPCNAPRSAFALVARGIRVFVANRYDMSQTETARYFRVDVRTLRRWQETRDFPRPHRNGHKEVSYNVAELLEWQNRQQKIESS